VQLARAPVDDHPVLSHEVEDVQFAGPVPTRDVVRLGREPPPAVRGDLHAQLAGGGLVDIEAVQVGVGRATPFTVIERLVNSGVLAADTYLLPRTVWPKNDPAARPDGGRSRGDPRRQARGDVQNAAALYEGSGRIIASTGNGPFRLICDELDAWEPAL